MIKFLYIFLLIVGVFVLLSFAHKPIDYAPKDWPKPIYNFKKNPLNNQVIALGRMLFYDPILSRDSTISCSSCHLSYTGFTHTDHDLSHGIEGLIGKRNAPGLMNLAWQKTFMWDGAVNHIEVQALAPISNKLEMDESIGHVAEKLQRIPVYTSLFEKAFGESKVSGEYILKSLAQFMLTLVSCDAKYDRVMRKKERFTDQEERGYHLFQQHCGSCHQEPLFTNGEFENNGLAVDTTLNDFGRMGITLKASDSLLFKVPTLRNIEFTFPYMHDGRFKSLSMVMKHYTSAVQQSTTLSKKLKGNIVLSSEERVDIIAFLLTLTDQKFLMNPDFVYNRK